MFYKMFKIGKYDAVFVQSGKTPLKDHRTDTDLCMNGSRTTLTIPIEEVETAIQELQEKETYNGFIVSDFLEAQEKRRKEAEKKNIEYWENVHKEIEKKKEKTRKIINQIETYSNNNEGYELVYNKLEDMIKEGYFLICKYGSHKGINLSDAGIFIE